MRHLFLAHPLIAVEEAVSATSALIPGQRRAMASRRLMRCVCQALGRQPVATITSGRRRFGMRHQDPGRAARLHLLAKKLEYLPRILGIENPGRLVG